ncbi:MAG: hypothetical protein MUF19_03185 [Candidatus Pacebacteria bacterium]|jgi:hypothetical protein|nr:hypothetical protein [Candidatus Paceibacterota bacterium]
MPEFPDFSLEEWSSIISLLLQAGVLVVAIYALRQISEVRETRRIQAARDSGRYDTEIILFYLREISPLISDLSQFCKKYDIKLFDSTNLHNPTEMVAGTISDDEITGLRETFVKHPQGAEFNSKLHKLLNLHEGLAAMLNSKLCNDEFLYNTIGNIYLSFINQHNRRIRLARRGTKVRHGSVYQNITDVYSRWYKHNEIRKAKIQINALDKAADELNQELRKNVDGLIPNRPIGL